ncbi:MAG: hypothetical protein EB084_05065 [Proteobacteria bacterium]|nr:hypothetical protein [Pseudomonadota bacterium]
MASHDETPPTGKRATPWMSQALLLLLLVNVNIVLVYRLLSPPSMLDTPSPLPSSQPAQAETAYSLVQPGDIKLPSASASPPSTLPSGAPSTNER